MTTVISAEKRLQKRKVQKAVRISRTTAVYALLVLVAVLMLVPFYWMLLISFRPYEEISSYPVNLLPTSFTFDHYLQFFEFRVKTS